jgi:glycosyltransferase involved in cell wall biosynthesis
MLLDFSVRAPGGSTTYATGFLDALAGLVPEVPAAITVLVPRGADPVNARLGAAGCEVIEVRMARAGTWRSRIQRALAVSWWSWRCRAAVVFVPREAAPPLVHGRLVIAVRNLLIWQDQPKGGWAASVRTLASRRALVRAAAVIAPSQALADVVPRTDVQAIHYGSDLAPLSRAEKQSCLLAGDGPLHLVCIGTVSRHKRHDVAIDLAAAVTASGTPCRLSIFGSTPDQAWGDELRARSVERLGYDALRGELDPAQRRSVLGRTDVLVAASSTESFGFPLLEGMRTSCVVLAPDAPLTHELCGDAALFYTEGSADDAAAVLLAAQPRLASLAEASSRRGEQFSWDQCGRETLRVLAAALQ